MKKILVTGGAGYIGSHVIKLLGKKGYNVLTYDNLSSGNSWAVLSGELVHADLADEKRLDETISSFKPDAVIHFAASIVVPESTKDPIKYYTNNTFNTLRLLKSMNRNAVNKIIFSSTAAVYGNCEKIPIKENFDLSPISPYGTSKLVAETMLKDLSKADDKFKYVSMRYFNVAGADRENEIGQAYKHEASHLLTRALKAAKGEIDKLEIFGTDYPTKDGTCVRDYIHVEDLAGAHVKALEYLISGGNSDIFNCGYGEGYSVREMVNSVKKVTNVDFKVLESKRRAGDSPALVSDSSRLKRVLAWEPECNNLDLIVKTAWDWEKNLESFLKKQKRD